MVRVLLILSALSFLAFWIVALVTDGEPRTLLLVLLLLGTPSVIEPFVTARRTRGARRD